jgi:hypothetical protein
MFNISNFLQKFKSVELEDMRQRSIVIDAIKTCSGIDIPPEKISFLHKKIQLSISPIEKNEIFMKKTPILALIKKNMAPRIVEDIS